MTSIVVAFPKIQDAKNIRNLLMKNGFNVSAVATSGAQVLELTDEINEGVVICGYKLPDMIYTQIKELLHPGIELMLIASREHITQGNGDIVCVEMPIRVHDLLDTVSMLTDLAESRKRKRREVPKARDDASKEMIKQAKLLLMERNSLSEEEAHRYLQKTSMDSGSSLKETAEKILLMYN